MAKKLTLNRETITKLTESDVEQAGAGKPGMPCTATTSGGGMCTSGTNVAFSCCSLIFCSQW